MRVTQAPDSEKFNLVEITPKELELIHTAINVQVVSLTYQNGLTDAELKAGMVEEQKLLAASTGMAFDETEFRLRLAAGPQFAEMRKQANTNAHIYGNVLAKMTEGMQKIIAKRNPIIRPLKS